MCPSWIGSKLPSTIATVIDNVGSISVFTITDSKTTSLELGALLHVLLGGPGRIRTYEGINRQIYSLLPLAAWVPTLTFSLPTQKPISINVKKTLTQMRSNLSVPFFPKISHSRSELLLISGLHQSLRLGRSMHTVRPVNHFLGVGCNFVWTTSLYS